MKLLILVVDDEPDVEALFRQQFRREMRAGRFVMDFASSGAQALQRVQEADEESLILLLSDINMPGMTGLELLPRVKAMLPELPVIMITAYGDAATLRRAKEAGADDVFGKPIDFAALKAEIDQRLVARGLPA
jgi:CheY-like chemotaxis protein